MSQYHHEVTEGGREEEEVGRKVCIYRGIYRYIYRQVGRQVVIEIIYVLNVQA